MRRKREKIDTSPAVVYSLGSAYRGTSVGAEDEISEWITAPTY